MLNAKGSIFDLDGTILDSMGMWMDIDIRFLREHGIRATEDYSQAVKTMGYRGAAEYTVARYGLSLSPEEVIARWSEMADAAYASEIRLKSGAIDYLRCLREAGQKLAVATALGFSSVESALSNNRILDLFDVFTMVHEVKRGKHTRISTFSRRNDWDSRRATVSCMRISCRAFLLPNPPVLPFAASMTFHPQETGIGSRRQRTIRSPIGAIFYNPRPIYR